MAVLNRQRPSRLIGRVGPGLLSLCGPVLAVLLFATQALGQDADLTVPDAAAPGARIEVFWQGPDAAGDFIAIAEPEAPAASFIAYARTSGGSPAVLTAPGVGEYELRYISAAGLVVLARVPLSVVVEAAQRRITAPSEVEAGADLVVSVSAPGDPADYITIVETAAPDDAFGPYARLKGALEVSLSAPDVPGIYEIRHIRASGQTVLARSSLTVLEVPDAVTQEPAPAEPVTGTATAAAAPQSTALPHVTLMALVAVDRGHGFRVAWSGPRATGDLIAVIPKGGVPAAALDNAPVGAGSFAGLTAPEAPGRYEIVYVDGASGAVLTRRELEVR